MYSLAIIIPCYNEIKRLQTEVYMQFSKYNRHIQLVFVDDGSKDETAALINKMSDAIDNVHLISYKENKGKGNALREGMMYALNGPASYIAYMDADLSAPIEEIVRLFELAKQEKASIIFGSRIKKMDTTIIRSPMRHFFGRMIATIIDTKFKFNCYDTQCGAKVFDAAILKNLIADPFYTRWFPDVELLCRARKQLFDLKIIEEPLKIWKNVKESKISIFSTGLILKELYTLFKKY